jgi:hypothetical protein
MAKRVSELITVEVHIDTKAARAEIAALKRAVDEIDARLNLIAKKAAVIKKISK